MLMTHHLIGESQGNCDTYWVLVVPLEERISAGREEDRDQVVLEHQHRRGEVQDLVQQDIELLRFFTKYSKKLN